jgi:hypothetical protein
MQGTFTGTEVTKDHGINETNNEFMWGRVDHTCFGL